MSLVLDLADVAPHDRNRVGGKAVALAALQRAGWKVPPTLCLTTEAYVRFVEEAGLRAVIHQELGRKAFADMRWEEVWDAALRIRNRFLRAPMPADVREALEASVASWPAHAPLVVRSSAPAEDGRRASFAGLHDSVVGVHGTEAVLDAVRTVWASLWSDRALIYRRELGLRVDGSAMGVVLQRLVQGESSGVAFAVHPSEPDRIAVEAVYGLNQGLVDGLVEPDRWVLDRETGRVVRHDAPARRERFVEGGTTPAVAPVTGQAACTPPLAADALAEIHAAVTTVSERLGGPQDVEWTLAAGKLVLLQSRPITASSEPGSDRRTWYLSLTRSLENLRVLRARVEDELLPAMAREARILGDVDLARLTDEELAEEIARRRQRHDHWVDVYGSDLIPLAHGIRLFGRFYNEVVRPRDPFEFMSLLVSTPLLGVQRNAELARLAARIRVDDALRASLRDAERGDDAFEKELAAFEERFGGSVYVERAVFADRARLVHFLLRMADASPQKAASKPDDARAMERRYLAAVDDERRALAEEVLAMGRASYRLRDDDNLVLARIEARLLEALAEADRRGVASPIPPPDGAGRRLRHPNRVAEPEAATPAAPQTDSLREQARQLVGQPAGPGVAVGPARIVRSVDDLFTVERGDVVVCDAVDPNMTFVVPLAAAVVERRGGMLVHGAIVAREYGLPCVTGVPDALARIRPGDELTVDGYLGLVTRRTTPRDP